MDSLNYFNKYIYPEIKEIFGVVRTDFKKEGDFGYLTRFDLYSKNKIGNVDIWDRGVIGLEIFKIENLELTYIHNKLFFPGEINESDMLDFKRVLLNE